MRHHVLRKQNVRARARECFFALRGKSVNLFGCIGAMDISRMHRVACALYLTNPPDYGLLNMRARAVYPVSLPAPVASERARESAALRAEWRRASGECRDQRISLPASLFRRARRLIAAESAGCESPGLDITRGTSRFDAHARAANHV